MSRRTVKYVAIGYAVKVALVGALWLTAPDLARHATDKLLSVWSDLTD